METAGKQAAFDLHQLAVNGSHQGVSAIQIEFGCILSWKVDILVEIALTRRLNNRVDDLNASAAFTQLLVGADQFSKFLKSLVETCIFRRWGEIADCWA